MAEGSFKLGYLPGNTAFGEARWDPGLVGDALDGGFDFASMAKWLLTNKQPRDMTSRTPGLRMDPNARLKQAAEREQLLADMARSRAVHGTPGFGGQPLRTVSGPGIVTGLTPDTIRMTGAQRQAFLPQSAQAVADPNPLFTYGSLPGMGQVEGARQASRIQAEESRPRESQADMAARMYPGFARYAGQNDEQREADRQRRDRANDDMRSPRRRP